LNRLRATRRIAVVEKRRPLAVAPSSTTAQPLLILSTAGTDKSIAL
jgi:hypothetical protein